MSSTKLSIRLRVVIDTNVFISAFLWGGTPQKVVNRWLEGGFRLLVSPFLISEILLVLERFSFPPQDCQKIKTFLETQGIKIIPQEATKICRDPKDNQILDLCLKGKANFLVTGDKDLLAIKKFFATKIVSPRRFLELI